MTPHDNVFYFGDDIDVRVCLKNGYTSVRTAWAIINRIDSFKRMKRMNGNIGHFGMGGTPERYNIVMAKQDLWDQPFRRGSYRIAIKRDPVERFKSAVTYLEGVKLHKNYELRKKEYIDLTYVNKEDIDMVLDAFDKQLLRDEHFFSQTYFMGSVKDYDIVYDISELSDLMSFLQNKFEPEIDVSKLHQNKNPKKEKVGLTPVQEIRIIKTYAKDYSNGWY